MRNPIDRASYWNRFHGKPINRLIIFSVQLTVNIITNQLTENHTVCAKIRCFVNILSEQTTERCLM